MPMKEHEKSMCLKRLLSETCSFSKRQMKVNPITYR